MSSRAASRSIHCPAGPRGPSRAQISPPVAPNQYCGSFLISFPLPAPRPAMAAIETLYYAILQGNLGLGSRPSAPLLRSARAPLSQP